MAFYAHGWKGGLSVKRVLLLLAVLFFAVPAFAEEASFLYGDLNGDGIANAADAAGIGRAAAGITVLDNADSARADLTGDQIISGADAKAILLSLTGLLDSPESLPALTESLCAEEGLERFSFTGTLITENGYASDSIAVSIFSGETEKARYTVADVCIRDAASFKTAFSGGEYRKEDSASSVEEIAVENGALLAINGDQYTQRSRGIVVRNGTVYREGASGSMDACVLYADGTMRCFEAGSYDMAFIQTFGAPLQSWCYGPSLLTEEGETADLSHGSESDKSRMHRSAVGFFAPGHYCFVTVESGMSGNGMNITELAELMHELGCKAAYQLAGGKSSCLWFNGRAVGGIGGRSVSDILCVAEAHP